MQSQSLQKLPLKDLHLPAEPGFWPPAPGWWIVAAILLVILIWGGFKFKKYRRKKQQWHRLEQIWQNIKDDYSKHQDKSRLARESSALLRRYVRHRQEATAAAELTGQDWIAYLNKGLKKPVFDNFSKTLTDGLFQQQNDFQADQLLQAVHDYLKHHSLHTNNKTSQAVKPNQRVSHD